MSAAAEESRRDGELPPLLDVFLDISRVGGRTIPRTMMLPGILLACSGAVALGVFVGIGLPTLAVLGGASVVGLIAILRFASRHSQRKIAASLGQVAEARGPAGSPYAEEIRRALTKVGAWTFEAAADELAARLLRDGRAGQIVRACRETEAFAALPIEDVFEPVKLDSSDAGFRELVEAVDQSAAASPEDERQRRRRRNPSERAAQIMIDLFVVAFCVVMMLNSGGVAPKGIGGGMLAMWAVWRIVPALLMERQWVLVPGGVLVRRSSGMGKQWRSRLFTRGESVLVVWSVERSGQTAWEGLLCGEAGTASRALNGEECEMLLRAWMSPVAAPSLERLGDLA